MPKEPEGATPATISNHPFTPEGEWWSQCKLCGLSEAAHFTTTLCHMCGGSGVMGGADRDGNYDRCDECAGTGLAVESDVSRPDLEGES